MKLKGNLRAFASLLCCTALVPPTIVHAQEAASGQSGQGSASSTSAVTSQEIVVTGSRIRQATDTATSAPVALIDSAQMTARGFTSAGNALSEISSMPPQRYANSPDGTGAGVNGQAALGANYPNLFNLGAGRTLTLVNGRRMVSTSGGLGDEAVDANIMPLGLLQRMDVVQGGGAVVYGSGAIAGVVNYVLKDKFEGIHLDVQGSETSRWDYATGSIRLTAGTNFDEGRGNIAIDFDMSRTGDIRTRDRDRSFARTKVIQNLVAGAGTNGIPRQIYVSYYQQPQVSTNGTLLASDALFGAAALLRINGQAMRFNDTGTALVPFDPGTPSGSINALGGDYDTQWDNGVSSAVVPQVSRYVVNALGHYELTDNVKLSGELTFAKVQGTVRDWRNFLATYVNYLGGIAGLKSLTYTKNNPYLSPALVTQISAVSPTFASGGAIPLGKGYWRMLFEDNNGAVKNTTDTYRGVFGLDGNFTAGERRFDWSVSYEHSEVHLGIQGAYPIDSRLRKAVNAARNANGDIVCAVNADADPNNNDAACIPINMFGSQPITAAQRNYIMTNSGIGVSGTSSPFVNKEDDVLATLSGELFKLPAGRVQFSTSFEWRRGSAAFNPLEADRLGLVLTLIPVVPAAGSFTTKEFAGELEVPLLGDGVSLPGIQELVLNGAYRHVDHSLAGKADVFGAGLRWKVVDGLRLRANYSRNFRAPNLAQLLLPSSATNGGIINPCGPDQIVLGPNPSVRRANCLAQFQANTSYGTGSSVMGITQVTPVGASAETRLANFIRATNGTAVVTTVGNPNLRNEISNTLTFGFIFEPQFIPGLMISADWIDLKLTDAIVQFSPAQFAAACFDASPQPADLCNTLTYDASGQIIAGRATAVNAGRYRLKADTYTINYRLPLERLFGHDAGVLNFGIQATHNRFQSQTIGGATTRFDNTTALPRWSGRLDIRYAYDKFKLNYTMNYLSKVKTANDATPETSPDLKLYIPANVRHNISAEYDFGRIAVRAGVNNLTDRGPSFPTTFYGDLIGRSFFLGASVDF